jgi:hypothetical protein
VFEILFEMIDRAVDCALSAETAEDRALERLIGGSRHDVEVVLDVDEDDDMSS